MVLEALALDERAFGIFEVSQAVTDRARALLLKHALRSSDSIQLASCLVLQDRLEAPVVFVAFDRRLLEAAAAEGLACLGE